MSVKGGCFDMALTYSVREETATGIIVGHT